MCQWFLWMVSILLLANPLIVNAQDDQEFKPCTGPACNPSHRNHRKDARFVPHKKKQANIKHLRKQQIAKAKQFQAQQKRREKFQRKLQAVRQKNPKKFHKTLDKAQNPYRIKRYKPKSLDFVTYGNKNKIRRKGLDNVSIPQYSIKHNSLDNKRSAGSYQPRHRNLDKQRYASYKVKHRNLDSRRYASYQQRHRNLDKQRYASYKVKHRNLDSRRYASYQQRHRNLDKQRYASYKVKHRNLDSRRYASYQQRHRNLDKQRYASYKVKHRNLDSRRYASYQQRHHQRDLKTMPSYNVRHKSLDRRRMASYYVRHKNLDNQRIYTQKRRDRKPAFKVDKPTKVARQYAQQIKKGLIVLPTASYVMLSRNPKNFTRMRHKQYDGVTMPRYRMSHRGLDGISPKSLKIRHKNLDFVTMSKYKQRRSDPQNFCYPKVVVPHRSLDQMCYPKLVIPHRQLDNVCYPKLIVPHKQLDFACGERPFRVKHKQLDFACGERPFRVKHKQLDFACGERPFRVKHKQLDFACGERPFRVKHKQLDFACGERPFRVKHKQLDNVCYKSLKICHRPLDKYRVPCDPNIVQPKSNLERVGDDLKYFFTNKKRFCKLNSIYSGVSAGQIIETQKYGKGVVTDYIVRNRLIQYVRYVNGDSTKIKVKYRKSPSIKHLVVLVPRDEKKLRKSNGDPNLKKVKLSQRETKEIMMKHLIERRNFVWLIRMYPEEEQNLPELYAKYGGYKEIKHPAFQKK
ncbi:MAG: hypothetical protein KatS3mg035_0236 [Bacteroidia bacterium]|nr:MAG: hypothetical protein KatS3mg035_0236 [Bacteroidia bacterium]